MRLSIIFVTFTLCVIVKGTFWAAAAARPLVLSIGAILTAFDLDVLEVQPLQWLTEITEKTAKTSEKPKTKRKKLTEEEKEAREDAKLEKKLNAMGLSLNDYEAPPADYAQDYRDKHPNLSAEDEENLEAGRMILSEEDKKDY